MEKKKFIWNCAGVCPVCGKRDLEWGYLQSNEEEIGYDYVCKNCGVEGTEYYKLVFNGHVIYHNDTIEVTEDVNDYIAPEA